MKDKWVLKSKTVWGMIIVVIPMVLALFNLPALPDMGAIADAGINFIDNINEIVGFLLIAWGRYTAGGTRLVMS